MSKDTTLNLTTEKMTVADLVARMEHFLNHTKPKPEDWIVIEGLVKQFNKQRYCVSPKVLRSAQHKFEIIQNKYQR